MFAVYSTKNDKWYFLYNTRRVRLLIKRVKYETQSGRHGPFCRMLDYMLAKPVYVYSGNDIVKSTMMFIYKDDINAIMDDCDSMLNGLFAS